MFLIFCSISFIILLQNLLHQNQYAFIFAYTSLHTCSVALSILPHGFQNLSIIVTSYFITIISFSKIGTYLKNQYLYILLFFCKKIGKNENNLVKQKIAKPKRISSICIFCNFGPSFYNHKATDEIGNDEGNSNLYTFWLTKKIRHKMHQLLKPSELCRAIS